MTEIKKSYYAIIPANVRYDKDLTPNAKLLYGEITALCNQNGYCWAGNTYFAELYEVSKISVSKWVNQLVAKGYLSSTIQYKEGTKEIEYRYLRIVNDPIKENFNTPIRKVKDPIKEKLKDNTTVNNTSNTTVNNNMSSKLDDVSESIPYKEIVEYLNDKAERSYKHSTKKTRSLIKARWNEGFRLEEFKTVIDVKVASWSSNSMSNFLRPETLFGTKFESYLNEKGGGPNNESEYDGYF